MTADPTGHQRQGDEARIAEIRERYADLQVGCLLPLKWLPGEHRDMSDEDIALISDLVNYVLAVAQDADRDVPYLLDALQSAEQERDGLAERLENVANLTSADAHRLVEENRQMREERAAHAARAEELQRGMEFFVRYWWEQHKPDERDLATARLRVSQPDVQAALAALSAAHRPDDDAAPPSAGGAGDE